MKTLIMSLTIILALGLTGLCSADIPSNLEVMDEISTGAQIDAPNLLKLTENLALGAEVGIMDLMEDWEDSGYIMVKITYSGSLLDLTK